MDLNKINYFILTGASKGIGKTMAIECCRKFKAGSVAVLFARSSEGLESTKREILSINDKITVVTYSEDVAKLNTEDFYSKIEDSLKNHKITEFQQALIIHNVGSIGDVSKKAKEISDTTIWNQYYQLNVFSVAALNAAFMKYFANLPKIVVNITSACSQVPFKSFTLYCSGKAAREMYFKVLAEEEPDTIVLNYSPGPVDTDMVAEVELNTNAQEIKSYFKDQKDTKKILTPIQTVTKFLTVLEEYKFKSGEHIDYYDRKHV